jgi:hypothetical protein
MITNSNASNAAIASVERVSGYIRVSLFRRRRCRRFSQPVELRCPTGRSDTMDAILDEVGDNRVTAYKLRSPSGGGVHYRDPDASQIDVDSECVWVRNAHARYPLIVTSW